jgi:hypothetical protein
MRANAGNFFSRSTCHAECVTLDHGAMKPVWVPAMM